MNGKYTTKELVLYVAVAVVATLFLALMFNVVTSSLYYKPEVPTMERVLVQDRPYVPEAGSHD